jgi:hypothetical protein
VVAPPAMPEPVVEEPAAPALVEGQAGSGVASGEAKKKRRKRNRNKKAAAGGGGAPVDEDDSDAEEEAEVPASRAVNGVRGAGGLMARAIPLQTGEEQKLDPMALTVAACVKQGFSVAEVQAVLEEMWDKNLPYDDTEAVLEELRGKRDGFGGHGLGMPAVEVQVPVRAPPAVPTTATRAPEPPRAPVATAAPVSASHHVAKAHKGGREGRPQPQPQPQEVEDEDEEEEEEEEDEEDEEPVSAVVTLESRLEAVAANAKVRVVKMMMMMMMMMMMIVILGRISEFNTLVLNPNVKVEDGLAALIAWTAHSPCDLTAFFRSRTLEVLLQNILTQSLHQPARYPAVVRDPVTQLLCRVLGTAPEASGPSIPTAEILGVVAHAQRLHKQRPLSAGVTEEIARAMAVSLRDFKARMNDNQASIEQLPAAQARLASLPTPGGAVGRSISTRELFTLRESHVQVMGVHQAICRLLATSLKPPSEILPPTGRPKEVVLDAILRAGLNASAENLQEKRREVGGSWVKGGARCACGGAFVGVLTRGAAVGRAGGPSEGAAQASPARQGAAAEGAPEALILFAPSKSDIAVPFVVVWCHGSRSGTRSRAATRSWRRCIRVVTSCCGSWRRWTRTWRAWWPGRRSWSRPWTASHNSSTTSSPRTTTASR